MLRRPLIHVAHNPTHRTVLPGSFQLNHSVLYVVLQRSRFALRRSVFQPGFMFHIFYAHVYRLHSGYDKWDVVVFFISDNIFFPSLPQFFFVLSKCACWVCTSFRGVMDYDTAGTLTLQFQRLGGGAKQLDICNG